MSLEIYKRLFKEHRVYNNNFTGAEGIEDFDKYFELPMYLKETSNKYLISNSAGSKIDENILLNTYYLKRDLLAAELALNYHGNRNPSQIEIRHFIEANCRYFVDNLKRIGIKR